MTAPNDRAPGERIVAAASWLVPAWRRDDWIEDWQAELRYAWERGAGRLALVARATGALADALEMRRTHGGDLMLSYDVRFAARQLARRPGFTTLVALTLALGIGATTAVFTVVDGVLLRPLPFAQPERLVELEARHSRTGDASPYLSATTLGDWRDRRDVVERVAFHTSRSVVLSAGEARQLRAEGVSAEFFPLLGVAPELGRTFAPEESAGGARVAVISDALWRGALGADRSIVGRTLTLDTLRYLVVGVMPASFRYPLGRVDVWVPLAPNAASSADGPPILALGRLARGVSLTRGQAFLDRTSPRVAAARGDAQPKWLALAPIGEWRANAGMRRALLVLTGAVACVLLIACGNAAGLLLVRGAGRRQEIDVRLAIGASRGRVMRELLVESALLAAGSGALGVALAYAAVHAILRILPPDLTVLSYAPIAIDARVLAFAVGASVLTGVLFGVAPALRATSGTPRLGGERLSTGSVDQRRARAALVIGELALSVMLLVGAGLLMNSFVRLVRVSPGMDVDHLALLDVDPAESRYPTRAERAVFYDAVLARVRSLPGVRAASVVSGTAGYSSFSFGVRLEAEGGGVLREQPSLLPFGEADTSYFRTLGIPILAGRAFGAADVVPNANVAIVDPDLARALWRDGRAVGHRFRVDSGGPWLTVVGIAGDVKLLGADDREGRFELYYPSRPGVGGQRSIAVRTAGDPALVLAALKRTVHDVDPAQPVLTATTARDRYRETLVRPRFLLVLMAVFAAIAATLAGVGLYGVVSYAVAQRTREFGIRMALGANARRIVGSVLGAGSMIVAIGVGVGVVGALAAMRVLASLLFGVSPTDPVTIGSVVLGLVGVTLLACWIPARRASRVDPVAAVRAD